MNYKEEIEKIETKARMDRYVTDLLETRKDELEMAICDGTINKALKTIWNILYKLEGEPDYGCCLMGHGISLKGIAHTPYEIDVEPPTFHQGAELYNKDCILKICRAIGLSKAVFNYGRMD